MSVQASERKRRPANEHYGSPCDLAGNEPRLGTRRGADSLGHHGAPHSGVNGTSLSRIPGSGGIGGDGSAFGNGSLARVGLHVAFGPGRRRCRTSSGGQWAPRAVPGTTSQIGRHIVARMKLPSHICASLCANMHRLLSAHMCVCVCNQEVYVCRCVGLWVAVVCSLGGLYDDVCTGEGGAGRGARARQAIPTAPALMLDAGRRWPEGKRCFAGPPRHQCTICGAQPADVVVCVVHVGSGVAMSMHDWKARRHMLISG